MEHGGKCNNQFFGPNWYDLFYLCMFWYTYKKYRRTLQFQSFITSVHQTNYQFIDLMFQNVIHDPQYHATPNFCSQLSFVMENIPCVIAAGLVESSPDYVKEIEFCICQKQSEIACWTLYRTAVDFLETGFLATVYLIGYVRNTLSI